MSLIDSYSRYHKDEGKKTKYTLIDHSALYEPLDKWDKRSPDIPLYCGAVPDAVNCHSQRKPALSLTGAGGQYFTGLYIPDPARPDLAFGDFGNDSILCLKTVPVPPHWQLKGVYHA